MIPSFDIPHTLQAALAHHRAGRQSDAETLYRRILDVAPDNATALHYLGVLLHQTGRRELSMQLLERALEVQPGYADAHNSLGNILFEHGKTEEALSHYKRALAINPGNPETHNNMGNILQQAGRLDEAVESYRRASEINPSYALTHNNLGFVLHKLGRTEEALGCYQRALALQPNYAKAHFNLGIAYQRLGRFNEAVACYQRTLALHPNHLAACNSLGTLLKALGNPDKAIDYFEQALKISPDSADGHINLGNCLLETHNLSGAIEAYQSALKLAPDYAEAHNNLASALLRNLGDLKMALTHFREAVRLKPESAGIHCNLLMALNYDSGITPETVFSEHLEFARRHAEPLTQVSRPHLNERNATRRLRIGYVSGDFRTHSVAHFILPVLTRHDKKRYEVFCYSNHPLADQVTIRLQSQANHWRMIAGKSDEETARQIREDSIDILVDLSGCTERNRLLLFAHKPAPVQVTWIGYPGSTGLSAMDYRITDGFADPVGMTESLHSEQLVRLPEVFSCFSAPGACPEVTAPPIQSMGHATFGSFNNFAKLTPEVLALWARILRETPGSKLMLRLNSMDNQAAHEKVHTVFADLDIAAERLVLRDSTPSQQSHLERYHEIDIALDPFPYNGTTTNCDALWMGVPVVTLAGRTHASRVGVSQLSNLGLTELIARDPDEYVDIAVRLAKDTERLATLRAGLRARMSASPLMDAARLTQHLEAAYRRMWECWCEAPPATDNSIV